MGGRPMRTLASAAGTISNCNSGRFVGRGADPRPSLFTLLQSINCEGWKRAATRRASCCWLVLVLMFERRGGRVRGPFFILNMYFAYIADGRFWQIQIRKIIISRAIVGRDKKRSRHTSGNSSDSGRRGYTHIPDHCSLSLVAVPSPLSPFPWSPLLPLVHPSRLASLVILIYFLFRARAIDYRL